MIRERDLIDRIATVVGVRPGVMVGIGDDAAVLDGGPPLVVTVDLLVDGVHFRRSTATLTDIGHKALAVNLSDLAAMGAVPVAAFAGLGIPDDPSLTTEGLLKIFEGMDALAARFGVTIAGGDVTRAPALTIAVTAVGREAPGVPSLRRSGARAGDVVCVTGQVGAAAAGLAILDDPHLGAGVADAEALRRATRRPVPRVAAGQILAAGGATAMLDCSDGLALDASRIGAASGAGIEIDLERIPVAPGAAEVAAALGRDADVMAATGGDDYELIVTVPPAVLDGLRGRLDVPLTAVGRVTAAPGLRLLRGGAPVQVDEPGWEHRAG